MDAILPILTSVLIGNNTSVFNRSAIDLQEWWGPKSLQGQEDTSIRPSQIHFSDGMIKDLRHRLREHASYEPPLEDSAFNYGFNSNAIDFWIKYWAEEYPFKEREAYLNQFPQFKTNIQGLDIHFIHVKPKVNNKTVVPLLLIHGWPGSIREFYDVIPLLTADSPDRNFAVEVIVPCLPGYGFSDPAYRKGLGAVQVAVIMRNLMQRLGHKQFYVQGGDWGALIGSYIATIFQEECLGFHTGWGVLFSSVGLKSLESQAELIMLNFGYFHQAATKPDSVGFALADSPAGLVAYILEKFSGSVTPANNDLPDGGLHNTFPPEALVDNLMFYWAKKRITSSLRLYAETFNKKERALGVDAARTSVPIWVAQGLMEFPRQPPEVLRTKYDNLLNYSILEVGNHFLAFGQPKVFTDNVLSALEAFIDFHTSQK